MNMVPETFTDFRTGAANMLAISTFTMYVLIDCWLSDTECLRNANLSTKLEKIQEHYLLLPTGQLTDNNFFDILK
jgi:hypothetical protein